MCRGHDRSSAVPRTAALGVAALSILATCRSQPVRCEPSRVAQCEPCNRAWGHCVDSAFAQRIPYKYVRVDGCYAKDGEEPVQPLRWSEGDESEEYCAKGCSRRQECMAYWWDSGCYLVVGRAIDIDVDGASPSPCFLKQGLFKAGDAVHVWQDSLTGGHEDWVRATVEGCTEAGECTASVLGGHTVHFSYLYPPDTLVAARPAENCSSADALACSPCRPYVQCSEDPSLEVSYQVAPIGGEHIFLPGDSEETFSSKRDTLDLAVDRSLYSDSQSIRGILPVLQSAVHVSAGSLDEGRVVDIGPGRAGEFKVLPAEALLGSALELYRTRRRAAAATLADNLLLLALPHVRLGDRRLTLDDIVCFEWQLDRGAYFPTLHWDTYWAIFPSTSGFQLWYLLEQDDGAVDRLGSSPGGSMYLADAAGRPGDQPVEWEFLDDGSAVKYLNIRGRMGPGEKVVLEEYGDWREAGLAFSYLNLTAGQLVVMSKNMLHVSDPRPVLQQVATNRLALSFRALVRPKPGAPLRFWKGHHMASQVMAFAGSVHFDKNYAFLNAGRHDLLFSPR